MPLILRRVLGVVLLVLAAGALWKGLGGFGTPLTGDATGSSLLDLPRERRPVVLITVDTTRADRLEPYGAEGISTPHLADLAERGIVFDQAGSVAPITLVAHTSILSGRLPPSHGVRNNGLHYVADEVETLAEVLAAEGYRTGAFVSAAVLERRYGLHQGFEVYDDDLSSRTNRGPRMVADRPATAVVDAALEWVATLEEDDDFFLWVHFYDPHAVYSPPPPFRDDYRENLYDGEIAYMDAEIGRLLGHPRLGRGAIVSVIGDHGESLGEHGEQTHALLAYESTLRVPWILKVPGGPTGQRVAQPVSQIDMMPTILDALDLDWRREGVQGRSLLEAVEKPPLVYGETYLPYYTYGWAKLRSARRGPWKYIGGPEPELYDLRRDPHELSNQIDEHPGTAHDLQRDLDELLATLGDPDNEAVLALDAESAEKLRSLGYLAVGSGSSDAPLDQERPDPKEMIGIHVGLERARMLLQEDLPEQAVKVLRQALAKDSANLAALVELALALDASGRLEEAVEVAERALEIDPQYVRIYMILADFEVQRGDPAKALELLEVARGVDPRSLEVRLRQAGLLHRTGNRAGMLELLGELERENPDDARVVTARVRLDLLPRGEFEQAESGLRRALDRDPYQIVGWQLLGDVLQRTGRAPEAASAFREGLQREPAHPELHARLGILLARSEGGSVEAERHLREAIRLSDAFRADVHVALGGVLAEQGKVAAAQEEYDRVLAENPSHPGARNNRAVALFRAGKVDEAMALLTALTEEFPRHADAHNNLAAIAAGRGDWARTEKHARAALELRPASADAWSNLGLALEETGRFGESREAYDRALEIRPSEWRFRFNLAILLRKSGRPEEAAANLESVLESVPGNAEVHWELGILYLETLGDPGRARRHFNTFLELAPRDRRAEEARRKSQEAASRV